METVFDRALLSVLSVFPKRLEEPTAEACRGYNAEEIRLRVGRPPHIVFSNGDKLLKGIVFTSEDSSDMMERLCRHSVYAHEDELTHGFLTFSGGVRIGICGRPVIINGRIVRFQNVGSFNIRLPHEAVGCAEGLMGSFTEHFYPVSSLVIAPPAGGKTTLLRDIVRCLSNGIGTSPLKVCLADERGEVAGCIDGTPSFEIGTRTDVMELMPKAEAISMFIRTMSPDVIATDEIGGACDAEAVSEAGKCGVTIIATAHASSAEELFSRSSLKAVLDTGVFKRILLLRRHGNTLRIFPVKT